MYTGMIHLHTILRWVVLVLAVVVLVRAVRGGSYTVGHRKLFGAFLGTFHLQVVIGLVLYFLSPLVSAAVSNMGAAMKNPALRFYGVEHIAMMLIAAVVLTIGFARTKRASDDRKHSSTLMWVGITLLIAVVAIPWPFRGDGVGRGLMPGARATTVVVQPSP
jgi:hypothetical protein